MFTLGVYMPNGNRGVQFFIHLFVPVVLFSMNGILVSANFQLNFVDDWEVAIHFHILLIFEKKAVIVFLPGW